MAGAAADALDVRAPRAGIAAPGQRHGRIDGAALPTDPLDHELGHREDSDNGEQAPTQPPRRPGARSAAAQVSAPCRHAGQPRPVSAIGPAHRRSNQDRHDQPGQRLVLERGEARPSGNRSASGIPKTREKVRRLPSSPARQARSRTARAPRLGHPARTSGRSAAARTASRRPRQATHPQGVEAAGRRRRQERARQMPGP